MTEVTVAKTGVRRRERLYRLYYQLMTASMFAFLFMLGYGVLEAATGIEGLRLPENLVFIAVGIAYGLGSAGVLFLIIARFMRDDYAETLWKRTVAILAYIVAITPVALVALAWIAELSLPEGSTAFTLWHDFYRRLHEGGQGTKILTAVWHIYNLLFVVIFQLLRWKDSR